MLQNQAGRANLVSGRGGVRGADGLRPGSGRAAPRRRERRQGGSSGGKPGAVARQGSGAVPRRRSPRAKRERGEGREREPQGSGLTAPRARRRGGCAGGGAACAAAPGQRRQGSGAVPRRRSPRAKRERGEGERAAGERTGGAGGDASKEPQKHPRAFFTVHHKTRAPYEVGSTYEVLGGEVVTF